MIFLALLLPEEGHQRFEMSHLLEISNLSVSFLVRKKWLQAVTGVSFYVDQGETLGIVGESGCGKSVTSMSMLHLLPKTTSRVDSGTVIFDGTDISGYSDKEMSRIRGRRISMIFQDSMTSLNPVMTNGAQLVEAIKCHDRNISKKEAEEKAISYLAKVGIPSPEKRFREYPHQLSGGMRQRVMIAMALIQSPSILIADEPTTALDVTIQAQILELMQELKATSNVSIMLITHDMGVVAEMADRVMVMYAGNVMEVAPTKEIFANPMHPYSQGLLASIPRPDKTVGKLSSIEGTVPTLQNMPVGCRFSTRCSKCTSKCIESCPPLFRKDGHDVRCWLYADGEAVDGTSC